MAKTLTRELLRLTFLVSGLSILATAQYAPAPITPTVGPTCLSGSPGTLAVVGNGLAEAVADTGNVAVSVSNLNATAEGARQVAAGVARNVINSVTKIQGIQQDNVTTSAVSVQPKFTSDDNGVQTVQGYTYVNSLSIDIDNLTNDLLAQVLDTAVQTGGNAVSIDSVTFELSPLLADNLTIQAEASAVSDARNQAARYAKNFGTTLGPVLTVTTSASPRTSSMNTLTYRASTTSESTSDTTPVSVGKEQVTSYVNVVYTICTPQS